MRGGRAALYIDDFIGIHADDVPELGRRHSASECHISISRTLIPLYNNFLTINPNMVRLVLFRIIDTGKGSASSEFKNKSSLVI